MNIKIVQSDEDILKCFDVLHELRPHLKKENVVAVISEMMKHGYLLIYIEENGKAVSASGYRFMENLAWGKAIYIDDLSTLPSARRKGVARQLLDYIVEEARKNNCVGVHLESGCGAHRYDAHRLYLRYGFNIPSFHFKLDL